MDDHIELGWYHCILTTYGSWLPGDPRGFRTRHHRQHIEGDYKNPPPAGKYHRRHAHAKRLQRFESAVLTPEERDLLGRAAVKHLRETGVEILAIAISARHVHVQLKCPNNRVIKTLGDLKRKLWYVRRERGNGERLWGIGRKIVPIETHQHQRATLQYILKHRDEGAWVWYFRDAYP